MDLSWIANHQVLVAGCVASLFPIVIAIYRLYFSPLAGFPGPKIAALTSLYAAYHDLWRGSQYIWVVQEMHRKYGPIVRVRPDTLHMNDPEFIDKIYTRGNNRREKYKTTLNSFQADGSIVGTKDHNLHRRRRAVMNQYFSTQNVRRLEPVIQQILVNLLHRMEMWARQGEPAPMNMAFMATTKDIIQAYAFGEGQRCLEMPDLNAPFFYAMRPHRLNHLGTHFYYVARLLISLPPKIFMKLLPRVSTFVIFAQGLSAQIEQTRNAKDNPEKRTIFHDILQSNIPDSEKATRRLTDEAIILVTAGTETIAQTLAALTYHLLSNPPILRRLKDELESIMPDPDELPSASKLEGLPFFNAVIQEIIRLHPGTSHRQDRVAPDQALVYEAPNGKIYTIPAGVPVGMTSTIMNRNPELYNHPLEFRPDRYLENPSLQKYQMAFSRGSRQCIGINLAHQELQTITAGIFRKYDRYDGTGNQTCPTLELFQTTREDVEPAGDFIIPSPKPGSQGVRVMVRH